MSTVLEAAARYPVATVCPHPDQPGHGTGCCCAGRSQEAEDLARAWIAESSPAALTPDAIRQLLRESVTVVKPGEVLVLRCPEDWVPSQVSEMHDCVNWWLRENAPDIRAMVIPHLDMAVAEAPA